MREGPIRSVAGNKVNTCVRRRIAIRHKRLSIGGNLAILGIVVCTSVSRGGNVSDHVCQFWLKTTTSLFRTRIAPALAYAYNRALSKHRSLVSNSAAIRRGKCDATQRGAMLDRAAFSSVSFPSQVPVIKYFQKITILRVQFHDCVLFLACVTLIFEQFRRNYQQNGEIECASFSVWTVYLKQRSSTLLSVASFHLSSFFIVSRECAPFHGWKSTV